MARIRTVKPELLRHEELFESEQETGLPLRIAFVGLFTVCDREGRFKWKPRQLKLDVLPYDNVDFERVLDAFESRGFVKKYMVNGKEYGCIPSFPAHQVINNKEKASELPEPPGNPVNTKDSTRDDRVDDAIETPLNPDQGEGKGREKEGNMEQERRVDDAPPPGGRIEFKKIATLFNEILGDPLGKCRAVSTEREKHIRARINADDKRQSLDWWRQYFEVVRDTPGGFLLGQGPPKPDTGKPWKADFDWLINENNMIKILEGKYER